MSTYHRWKKRKAEKEARKRADSGQMASDSPNDMSNSSTPSPSGGRKQMNLKNPYQIDVVDRAKNSTIIA